MVATADRTGNNSTISSQAFGLLDCFVSGIDDVVYDIAETMARRRLNVGAKAPVEIVVADIEEAAQAVMDALRRHLRDEGNTKVLESEVDTMQRCFETKAKSLRG